MTSWTQNSMPEIWWVSLLPNGKGEFIAAIWILCPGGDYWSTLKCRLNDEDASLEEYDGLEFVPCGWDLEDMQLYFPIPELPQFPPLSATSNNTEK